MENNIKQASNDSTKQKRQGLTLMIAVVAATAALVALLNFLQIR